MRILKLTLRIVGGLALAAVCVSVLMLLGFQVPAGQAFLSGVASNLVSSDKQQIELEGLYLDFALNASVRNVTISDPLGPWFDASDLKVNWHPLALLSGRVSVASFAAGQVDLDRVPEAGTKSAAESAPGAGADQTGLGLSLPIDISLATVKISELNIGDQVLGVPVSMTAVGSASADRDPARLSANVFVERIDGVNGRISTDVHFEPASERLMFDIVITEPRGGMAARLLEIPDLPALDFALKGDGPLDNWKAALSVDLDGVQTASGSAMFSDTDDTRQLAFSLDGNLSRLAPPQAQAFLLGQTHANGSATFSRDFNPQSGQLNLETKTVTLSADASRWGTKVIANADLEIDAGDGALLAVDLPPRRVAFGSLSARLTANGVPSAVDWSISSNLASAQTSEGRLKNLSLDMSGKNANLSPQTLLSPFDVNLTIEDVAGSTPPAKALNGPVSLSATGDLDGKNRTVALKALNFAADIGEASLSDTLLSLTSTKGQAKLNLTDLSRLAEVAQRQLSGAINADVSFDLAPLATTGTLKLAASASNVAFDQAQADALLVGKTTLKTSLELLGPESIKIKSLQLENPAMSVGGTIDHSPAETASKLALKFNRLKDLNPQLSGDLALDLTTSGPLNTLTVMANANSDRILLAGTPLDALELTIKAIADLGAPTAEVVGSASLNGQPLSAKIVVSSENGGAQINPLSLALAGNTLTGEIAFSDLKTPIETLSGTLTIDAPDLSTLSPLALMDLEGRLNGTLAANPETKALSLALLGGSIDTPALSLGSLKLQANLSAPYDPKTLSADLTLQDLLTSATPIRNVQASARPDTNGTVLTANVQLAEGSQDGLEFDGHLSQPNDNTFLLGLKALALSYQGVTSRLVEPTTVSYAAGTTTVQPLRFQLGNGTFSFSGKVGDTLDVNADLSRVPLNVANAFVPSLGLGGTLSGTAAATGSIASPVASWTINGTGLTAAELKNNGIGILDLKTTGELAQNSLKQKTTISGASGLAVSANGTVTLSETMPLAMSINGTVPLATLRRHMIEAGLAADGAINISGSVQGSVKAPSYAITAKPSAVKITSLSTGLTIQNVRGSLAVTETIASLNGLAADLATGGTFSASGTIGTTDGFPADISLSLNRARYVDPGLVTAEVDADIKVSGSLASTTNSALIGGTVTINKADVSIPESLPGAIPPVDVQHINAPAAIRQQVAELGGESNRSKTQQKTNPPRLDVLLNAPGRIFVRGRGLDAELEGSLKIVGTTADPQAIGAFSLRRGQLDILTRRLTFSRGSATFEGSLTPLIDFAATTSVNDTTITVTVRGDANDPEIAFTSAPELPQDEVLALLLFGKAVGNLSPTQIAQLAAAVATLTGGSDSGPLAQIRKSLGLDAIDINTDGEDGPSIGVGKYINDNIYLGVEQGTKSDSSRVKVDIDLDRGLKLRGEVGADGSSKAGIFFEKEY